MMKKYKVIINNEIVEISDLDKAGEYYSKHYKEAGKIELREGNKIICRKVRN